MTNTESPGAAWTIWLFRATTLGVAILTFDQSIFAGQFLSGAYESLASHRDGSTYVVIAMFASLIASVLMRWPGRGPWWPFVVSALLLGVVILQTVLGYRGAIGLHIPLGVLTIVLTIGLAVWAWWRKK